MTVEFAVLYLPTDALYSEVARIPGLIDDIASAAGITKGAVYWHFENKEELFQAILEEIRARWVESVQQPLSKERAPVKRLAIVILVVNGIRLSPSPVFFSRTSGC